MIKNLAKSIIISSGLALGAVVVAAQTNIYPWPASGYVGVGTASPNTFLHVVGDTSSNGVRLVRLESPATDTGITFKNTSSSGRIYTLLSSGSGSGIGGGLFSLVDDTAGAVRLTISPYGNVGVGTTLPSAKFEVSKDSNYTDYSTSAFHISSSSNPGKQIRAGYDSAIDAGYVQVAHTGVATKSLVLNPSGGNVGIGTATPSNTLDVRSGGSSAAIGLLTSSQAADALRLINSDGSLRISNGITANLLNLVSGNVGIGTTNPTQKLSVNGTICAKEVIVETSGWSDYVFADNYTLQPLSEVETHIKEHKHLPGIPSAQQVVESGVGLGEMQAKLLAKIEELTLHQIEQEKEIRRLNEEVRQIPELQAELVKLRK